MQTHDWITLFQKWLADSKTRLEDENIRFDVLGITPYVPSSIHVDFFAKHYEATVQLWADGQSDFHLLDWEAVEHDPDVSVKVTHYEFQSEDKLFAALDGLIRQLAPAQNQTVMSKTPLVVGQT
jgi:hypothetical protein